MSRMTESRLAFKANSRARVVIVISVASAIAWGLVAGGRRDGFMNWGPCTVVAMIVSPFAAYALSYRPLVRSVAILLGLPTIVAGVLRLAGAQPTTTLIATAATYIGCIFLTLLLVREITMDSPGLCSKCGYDLAGLRTLVCPECGHNLPAWSQIPRTPATV